ERYWIPAVRGKSIGDQLFPQRSAGDVEAAGISANHPRPDWFYDVEWTEARRPDAEKRSAAIEPATGAWVIFADGGGVGRRLAARLERRGERAIVVGTQCSLSALSADSSSAR